MKMTICDVSIGGVTFTECDEYTLTVGTTYLVHSDRSGFFLGTYAYASRTLGAFIFEKCSFYQMNYYGQVVLSDKPDKEELAISMTEINTRKQKASITFITE